MAQNFIGCDRDQSFLMPPDLRDWLPEGHLAWFVIDAVAGDGSGRVLWGVSARRGAAGGRMTPAMMVALLLYAYARGVRSAREIERACVEDVAFKMIAMNGDARSRDDRAVRGAARGGARGVVRSGAGVVW